MANASSPASSRPFALFSELSGSLWSLSFCCSTVVTLGVFSSFFPPSSNSELPRQTLLKNSECNKKSARHGHTVSGPRRVCQRWRLDTTKQTSIQRELAFAAFCLRL